MCERKAASAHVFVFICCIYTRYMCHVCMVACMHVSVCVCVFVQTVFEWVAGWVARYRCVSSR